MRRRAGLRITTLLPADYRNNYPEGTRFIVRRERPHPRAQLTLWYAGSWAAGIAAGA
jgi:hypothetical protein